MTKRRRDEEETEAEIVGSDLEQMVAMLEKSEIDYDTDLSEDEDESFLYIGDVVMTFNEDGDLIEIK